MANEIKKIWDKLIKFIKKDWLNLVLATVILIIIIFVNHVGINPPPYFKNNWKKIGIIVLIFVIFVTIKSIFNLNFKKEKNKEIKKMIVVEKFKGGGFCDRDSESLEESCGKLLENPCKATLCCAWAKKQHDDKPQCIAGNENGPIFKSDEKGRLYNFDYYYYKGKQV